MVYGLRVRVKVTVRARIRVRDTGLLGYEMC